MENSTIKAAETFINDGRANYYIEIKTRLVILEKMYSWILTNQDRICFALKSDLSKSNAEAIMSEISCVVSELRLFLKNLKKWTKPIKVKGNFFYNFFFKSHLNLQPLGVCLIIAPYNYPLQLSLLPLIESIAAGNYNVLKLSEKTGATYAVIKALVEETQIQKYVLLLDQKTSHQTISEIIKFQPNLIFFTGGNKGGRIIENQARELGIKTILELGSACPVIVDETADIQKAAKKIAWGKALNSGQTCVAPNTIYLARSIAETFISELNKAFKTLYGSTPENNDDFPKMIDESSFTAVVDKIQQITQKKLNVNVKQLKIRPEVVLLKKDQSIACEEIFGPILFIVIVDDFNDAMQQVLKYHNSALASYYFGKDKLRFHLLIQKIKSGSWNCNEVVLQVGNVNLAFGGIDSSGTGRYHGYEGLKTFSNVCSVTKAKGMDPYLKYPPYTVKRTNLIKKIFKL